MQKCTAWSALWKMAQNHLRGGGGGGGRREKEEERRVNVTSISIFAYLFQRLNKPFSWKINQKIHTFSFEASLGSRRYRHGLWQDKTIIFKRVMLYSTPTTVSTACNFTHNEEFSVEKVIRSSCVIPTICVNVCMFPGLVKMWTNIIRDTTKANYNNAVWKRWVLHL